MEVSGGAVRRAARELLGALPEPAQRRIRTWRGLPDSGPTRTIELAELDDALAHAASLFGSSEDAARAFLLDLELRVPDDRPADPFSTEYREWTWDLYRRISGRPAYATGNEDAPFDLEHATAHPFPFQTGSATVVGEDLVARGHLLRTIGRAQPDLVPPARVVEFGAGWGNLTNDLVATGFVVTAVELGAQFGELMRRRCPAPEHLTVVVGDMLTFAPDEPYDAAVFFESFHHCSDHLAMLQSLHRIVRPGGAVFFGSEPVTKMPYPWGPRLDGMSLWSTRTYGWLELGFDAAYFSSALDRTGWHGERHPIGATPTIADVIVARA
jgi:SAM-dependent methyltransferase